MPLCFPIQSTISFSQQILFWVWRIRSHKMHVAADDCKYDKCEYSGKDLKLSCRKCFWFTHSLPSRNSIHFCLTASYHNLAENQPFPLNYQRLFGVGEHENCLHNWCIVYDSQPTIMFLLTPSRSMLIRPLLFKNPLIVKLSIII